MSKQEESRIYQWIEVYGMDEAVRRTEQQIRRYRKAVICDCDMYEYRDSLVRSYAVMKKFLRTGELDYEPKASEAYTSFCESARIPPRYVRMEANDKSNKESIQEDAQ